MQYTVDQVLGLAPDDSSAKAAKGLVAPGKWPLLGVSDSALWGECQGSGSKPYQVQMDFNGPAFRCSCPSRKFPCKHGLALLLLRVQKADSFAASEPPAWVAEWLASRQQRAETQERKQAAAAEAVAAGAVPTGPDPAAAAKRAAKRWERMAGGAADLERWLADQVSQGLSNLPGGGTDWRALAGRMVDAQAPGLAFRVRQLESAVASGAGWPARTLAQMGRLQLLLEAARRLPDLPPATQADVRAALGWPFDKDEVLQGGERVADRWYVLGQQFEENDQLWERRVWLLGLDSGRHALLLDFSHGGRRFERSFVSGDCLAMTLAFVPGTAPLRALVAGEPESAAGAAPSHPPVRGLPQALDTVAAAVAGNPWQAPLPLLVSGVVPQPAGGGWLARTESPDAGISLQINDHDGWQLTAIAGGAPLTLFGEWNGERLRPLSCWGNRLEWVLA